MMSLRHVGIVVSDLEASVRFWCEGVGFVESLRSDEGGEILDSVLGMSGVDVTTVKLDAPGGGRIELLRFRSHPGGSWWGGSPATTGLTHVALTVLNLEHLLERIVRFGAKPGPVEVAPDGRVRFCYCRGPEGVLLELVEELV